MNIISVKISKIFILALTLIFLSNSAMAAGFTASKDKSLEGKYLAILFHKITGQSMDFDRWARELTKDSKTEGFDKFAEQDKKEEEVRNLYRLLGVNDSVYVDMPVEISKYSLLHKGYFIKSFTDQSIFSYQHLGQNYAIIPQKIKDFQWVPMSRKQSAEVERMIGDERVINMQLKMRPLYGDKSAPMEIEGKGYWLTLAEVEVVSIWNKDESRRIWSSLDNVLNSKSGSAGKALIGLYRE